MEHTTDIRIAAEIAKDHISEDLHYYEKLDKMENPKEIKGEFEKYITGEIINITDKEYENLVIDKINLNSISYEDIKKSLCEIIENGKSNSFLLKNRLLSDINAGNAIFSATVRLGNKEKSWKITCTPSCTAWRGFKLSNFFSPK